MKIRVLLAAATCLSMPAFALAQPVSGPYVSLGVGTSLQEAIPYSYQNDEAGPVGKLNTRPSYAVVGAAGYGLGDGFRVELGGNYYRNTAHSASFDYEGSGSRGSATGGLNTYGVMLNGYYDISVGLPVYPYVGAGVGYQLQQFSHKIHEADYGVTTAGTQGSFAYDLIAGLAYPLPFAPGLTATAEYRFTQLVQTRNYNFQYFFRGVGTRVGQESSNTFLVGLRYALFAPAPMAPAPAPAPMAAPAPAPAKTYLVFFDWNKYDLTPRATQIIAEAASDSKTTKVTKITVSGYTDTSGTPTYNQGLSVRRAKAVAVKLMADGVPASEISIFAYGETHLLVPTGPGVREPQNRRVEIVLK